jgi:hypothetical protein
MLYTQFGETGSRGRRMALFAALLRWTLDRFEMVLFPLIGPNSRSELLASEIAENPSVKDAPLRHELQAVRARWRSP